MRILRVFAIALAIAATLLLIVAGTVWQLFDANDYRDVIAAELGQATGRELGIQGRIELKIWPRPWLRVSDLTLANFPGGSKPAFVTIREVEAEIALRPLLRGRLDIARVKIRGLDVLLETDVEGNGNWEIGTDAEPASGMASTLPTIDMLILEDVRISYWNRDIERALELRLVQAQIRDASLRTQGRLSATGSFNEQPWSVQGTFGPLSAEANGVDRLPMSIALSIAGADVNVAGHIDAPLRDPRPTLRISVLGRELADLLGASGVITDSMGSYEFSADLAGQPSQIKLQGIQGTMDGVGMGGEAVINFRDPQTPNIDFRHLELIWQGVDDGLPHAAQVDRLNVRLNSNIGRVEAGYAGRISGVEFAGSGRIGRAAAAENSSFDLKFDTTFGDAHVHLDGAVQPHASGPTGNADFRISGPDILVPAKALGLRLPLLGPYDLTANIVRGAGSPLGLTLGLKMVSLEARVAGEVPAKQFQPEDWVSHLLAARLTATASGPEVAAWMKTFGMDAPLQGAFKVEARLANAVLDGKVEVQDVNTRYEVSAKASIDRGPSPELPIIFSNPRGEAKLSGKDGTWLASSLGLSGFRLGPYAGRIQFHEESLKGSFELTLWEGKFGLDGSARLNPDFLSTGLKALESFEAGIWVSGADVSRLFEPLGWKTQIDGAFRAEGRASGNPKKVVLRDLQIAAGDTRLRGSAAVEFFEPIAGIASVPVIKVLSVRDVQASWSDRPGSRSGKLNLKRASLSRDTVDAAIILSIAGELDDRRFEVDGQGGPWSSLADAASPYRIALKGRVDQDVFSTVGVLGKPFGGGLNRLTFDVRGSDLANLNAVTGMDLPNTRPFDVSGIASFGSLVVSLKQLVARVGKSDLNGSLTLDLVSVPPNMTGRLTSKLIDLKDIPVPATDGTLSDPDAEEIGESVRLHGETPLPVDILRSLNADFGIKVDELRYGGARLTDTSLLVRGSAGHITLDLLGASVGQTGLEGQADLDVTADVPAAVIRFKGQNIDVGQLLKTFDVTDLITASANVELGVQGRGDSLHDILQSLDGSASIVADGGHIDSKYFDLVVSDLARELLPWRPKKQHTDINCFVARFDIQDGVATTEGLLLDTARATIVGEGSVNLGTEELEFTVRPNPKEVSLLSLAFPIDIRGTIAAPKFRPNKKALAIDAAKVAVATAINPLGILVPFIKAGMGDKHPCVVALEEASSGGVVQQAKPKGFGGQLLKTLGGAVKGIGGAVDKVLGK